MAGRKGGSFQGPLTKSGSFRKNSVKSKGLKTPMKKLRKTIAIDDCQRTLELRSAKTDQAVMVVQVPDMLARSNRRLYEQVRAYEMRIQAASTNTGNVRGYEIYTLSNAWWVKKSIEFAKAVYLDATKEERAMLGSRRGKWNAFTIDTFTGSDTNVNYSNLYQYAPAFDGSTNFEGMTSAEVTADESTQESASGASEVEGDSDLGDDIDFRFTIDAEVSSGSVRSYNIFDQYLLTRQHVSPTDTRVGPYKDLLEVDQVALKNMKEAGDNAPFDLDAFPSPWVLADTILLDQNDPGNTRLSKSITAPLGIVVIRKFDNTAADSNFNASDKVLVHCKSGKYKGVHAPSYIASKLK